MNAPTYDEFVKSEMAFVATAYRNWKKTQLPPNAPPAAREPGASDFAHFSQRLLVEGWTAEDAALDIATGNVGGAQRRGSYPGVPYGPFVTKDYPAVIKAYEEEEGHKPGDSDYAHLSWRLIVELWTVRDMIHSIRDEPLEDGGAGGAGNQPPPSGVGIPQLAIVGRKLIDKRTNTRVIPRSYTSFRLLHMMANGEHTAAKENLRWHRREGFNFARVLTTAKHLFNLPADRGRQVLPELLKLAADEEMCLSVVALADTKDWSKDDMRRHLSGVYEIQAKYSHTVSEGGNEIGPVHETQHDEILSVCRDFRSWAVPYCLGSVHGKDLCKDRDYLTQAQWDHAHAINPETGQPYDEYPYWDEVFTLGRNVGMSHLGRDGTWGERERRQRELEACSSVVNCLWWDDEGIGADEVERPGKRTNNPTAFKARGAFARVFENGSTFHSQAGLTSAPYPHVQEVCAKSFIAGSRMAPDSWVLTFKNTSWHDSPIKSFEGGAAIRIYSGIEGNHGIAVGCGVVRDPRVQWQNGWRPAETLLNEGSVDGNLVIWRLER